MSLTAEEATTLQAEIVAQGLPGAAAHVVCRRINADGSAQAEVYLVSSTPVEISKGELTAMLSVTSGAAFYDIVYGDPTEAVEKKIKLDFVCTLGSIDVTNPQFRNMVEYLLGVGKITGDEASAVKRLGERLQSRSEELFGRKLTIDEVQEVI